MELSEVGIATLRSGFLIGALVVAGIALIITLAVGVDAIVAIAASVGVGLVVGGPIGALFAARASELKK